MPKLEGKVAIVTGAASGIGQSVAGVFGREGARVAILDINYDGAVSVSEEINAANGKSIALRADVSGEADVKEAVNRVIKEFGKIDILVNNAAYLGFSVEHKLFMDTDEKEWDRHINVTFKGTLHCCKAVIPCMKSQKWGRIINITSDSSKAMAPKGEVVYSGCKAAVAGFSRCLAGELARDNILINCVSPGMIVTPALKETRPQEWIDKMSAAVPLRKPGEPEDIASMVLFLASEESKYITGQHYSVNGGVLMV